MQAKLVSLIALAVILMMCAVTFTVLDTPVETVSGTTTRNDTIFTNVSYEAGFEGVNSNFLAWGDYDNDGDEDLLISGDRLFRNNGAPDWTFTDVTESLGLTNAGGYGVWGDYDNDGWLDIYTCSGKGSTDVLFKNYKGVFKDASAAAEIPDNTDAHTAAGWADYDNDGYLDIYITGGEDWNDGNPVYYGDILLHNNGDGTFSNVTASAGVDTYDSPKYGRGVAWCDYNEDGYIDCYVSNYRIVANYLWENNGDGTFTDVALDRGVAGEEYTRLGDTYYAHTVGSVWADFNTDGDFDIWETALVHKDLYRGPICGDSQLLISDGEAGDWGFTNERSGSGIPEKQIGGGEDELFVGIAVGDYDNDGYEDMFIPQIYDDIAYAYSYMYRNNGDLTFTETSEECGIQVWNTYAGCWCDYDNDGDLDLITAGKEIPDTGGKKELRLFRNNGNDNHWVKLKLEGMESNKAAIGARVDLTYDGGTITKQVEGGMGCHGHQNSLVLEFGLGTHGGDVDVTVHWPNGRVQGFNSLMVDTMYTLTESTTVSDVFLDKLELKETFPVTGELTHANVSVVINGTDFVNSMDVALSYKQKGTTEVVEAVRYTANNVYPQTLDLELEFIAPDEGEYELTARIENTVPKDTITSNDWKMIDMDVRGVNKAPTAMLSVSSNLVGEGGQVMFDGSASYDDVGIVAYRFIYGDGEDSGWIEDSVVTHTYYNIGQYNASLVVEDTDGIKSEYDHEIITVEEGGGSGGGGGSTPGKPTARVVSVYPSPAYEGDNVILNGGVTSEEKIVEYRWRADGIEIGTDLSSTYMFAVAGVYNIEFDAMDFNGVWTNKATYTLEVLERPSSVSIYITSPSEGYTTTDSFALKGTASDAFFDISYVEVKIDGGNWATAEGGKDWEYFIDIGKLFEGNHTVQVRAFNSNGEMSMTRELHFTTQKAEVPKDDPTGPTDMDFNLWDYLRWIILGGVLLMFAIIGLLVVALMARTRKF